jgi:protein-tyrosine phosphatase
LCYPFHQSNQSKCTHSGSIKVVDQGNLRVWGGGANTGAWINPGWTILDMSCTGLPQKVDAKTYYLYWPNGGVPDVDLDYWLGLVDYLRERSRAKEVDLLVMCDYGHGRTGAALCIIACLLGAVPKGRCPVEWLRARYCQRAVETKGQAAYIERMTGYTVTSL